MHFPGFPTLQQNDTMRVIFMYHELEPTRGLVIAGNLPDPAAAFRGYRSLFLTQKPHQDALEGVSEAAVAEVAATASLVLELRNEDVELPAGDDTLYWCKMFKLEDITEKSHVIKVRMCMYTYTYWGSSKCEVFGCVWMCSCVFNMALIKLN